MTVLVYIRDVLEPTFVWGSVQMPEGFVKQGNMWRFRLTPESGKLLPYGSGQLVDHGDVGDLRLPIAAVRHPARGWTEYAFQASGDQFPLIQRIPGFVDIRAAIE